MSAPLSDADSHVTTELVDVDGMPLSELRTSRDAAVVRSLRHVVARSSHVGITEVSCNAAFLLHD